MRAIIVWIDPQMTNYTIDSEKDYGVDCWDITWDRLYSHLDWFAFGHYWGWGMKVSPAVFSCVGLATRRKLGSMQMYKFHILLVKEKVSSSF